ncbi:MnhB domain-containing protein [Thermogladius sp. 4427co]|uniref:MnhB domain-containing protein n=1 Tax=Thermogladius sp. 4427co TaxID=3450718 RepID=UPI003F795021
MRRLIPLVVIISFIIAFSLLLVLSGQSFYPSSSIRWLALVYLNTTFNPAMSNFTVWSPEAVTAIVWDYRGLDTLYETTVFYMAIVSGLALARGVRKILSSPGGEQGLSVIVKTVTKITAPMILAVAVSIALHGHLTPGGGFQGGATAAVVPVVVIVVFSVFYLYSRGMSTDKMLVVRSGGLIGIGLVSIALFIAGLFLGVESYVFQNIGKASSPISFPYLIGGALTSGTLWWFNLFEFFAVSAGFTIAFMILMSPEAESIE